MADKSVGELIAAQSVTPTDLFVLEQNGTAKKLTGQTLENWLVSFADGHGGIQNIEKVKTSGLVDTYRITLADTTTFDFMVTNGRGISSLRKTATSGLVDTYTFTYNEGTTGTFTVTNGEKGDKGDNAYIWVKYASQEPTASSNSFGDLPDDWMGVYFGTASTAPSDWQQYKWYRIKGDKGETGDPATLTNADVTYQVGDSGTIIPSGSWSASVPVVAQGKYLWTRTTNTFNTGSPVVAYSVSRMGLDGSGSVSSVANIPPDSDGNVPLKAESINALSTAGGDMNGPINMNGQAIMGLNAPTEDDHAVNLGYAQTAFAPAGYGYGEALPNIGTIANETDLETALTTVAAGLKPLESKQFCFTLTPYSGYLYVATIYKRTDTQYIVSAIAYSSGVRVYKRYNNGWKPLEWDNPPMNTGVEYRTTKVWKGSHVYVKMIDCGTLPSYGTSKRVAHGCSFKEVVDFRLIVNGTAIVAMEVGYNNAETIKTFLENTGNIVIDNQMTSSAIDSSTAKAVIEYVK